MKSPLDSRQLRAFHALAHSGSFTQAARELHLTQSAISHAIKALESDVGCRLLDRLGKKVNLTQAGEHLLDHTERILNEMAGARAGLENLGARGRGRLRLGASTTACQHLIPPVLREFKEGFPHYTITIQAGDTPLQVEALLQRRIDLALCLEPEHEPQLAFHPLFTDTLHFILSALHPWATAGRVVQAQIPEQYYILYDKRSVTFRMVETYFLQQNTSLNTVIELGSMEAIKALIKLGLGISILAPWIARQELEEGSLVAMPLGRRKLSRRWGILYWKGKQLNLAEETFVGLCEAASTALQGTNGCRPPEGTFEATPK